MGKMIPFLSRKHSRDGKTSVGLDIGSFSVKMVEIAHAGNGITVLNYAIRELPPDARGREKRLSPAWMEAVKQVIGQCRQTPDQLTLAFSGPATAIKRMHLPLMPIPEIETALRWEGKKQFTFPLDDARIFFKERGEKEEEGVKKMDLLVIAALKGPLYQEAELLTEILPGITGISPVPFAIHAAFRQMETGKEDEAVALIHVGAEGTSISIIKDHQLQFSREIYIAGSDLTRVLTEPFMAEGKQFTLSFERAEEIKRQYGIPLRDTQNKTEEGIPLSRIMFIIRPVLERLLTEIIRSFDFYKTQLKEKGIDRIFISGGTAKLKDLKEYLTGGLGIEVDVLDPFHHMALSLPEDRLSELTRVKTDLTPALGLAIEKAQEVNLLPPKPKVLETVELQKYALYVFPFLLFLMLSSFYYRADRSYRFFQQEVHMIKNILSSLNASPDKLDALRKEKTDLERELSFLSSPSYQTQYPKALKAITALTPSNLCFKKLSLEGEEAPTGGISASSTAGMGRKLKVEGTVFGSDANRLATIADMTEALEKSPIFNTVKLVSTGENREFNQPATDFTLICSLKPSPA